MCSTHLGMVAYLYSFSILTVIAGQSLYSIMILHRAILTISAILSQKMLLAVFCWNTLLYLSMARTLFLVAFLNSDKVLKEHCCNKTRSEQCTFYNFASFKVKICSLFILVLSWFDIETHKFASKSEKGCNECAYNLL